MLLTNQNLSALLVVNQINQAYYLIVISALVIAIVFLISRYFKKLKSISSLESDIVLLKKKNLELNNKKNKTDELDKIKSSYLTDISYQIRTYCNTIIGFLEFLTDNNLNENERTNYSQVIKNNNEQLLKVIDEILDMSMIENNQFKVKKETVSLRLILEETYLIFKENKKIKNSHIDFTYFIDDNRKDLTIISDSFRLKQILIILIDNAIKFTDSGQISFSYKLIDHEKSNYIQFRVDDSGIGIDRKFHERVFDRFFMINANIDNPNNGYGLGLSIAKCLVNHMVGKIWLQSELNSGSTFFFSIPCNIE